MEPNSQTHQQRYNGHSDLHRVKPYPITIACRWLTQTSSSAPPGVGKSGPTEEELVALLGSGASALGSAGEGWRLYSDAQQLAGLETLQREMGGLLMHLIADVQTADEGSKQTFCTKFTECAER